MAGLFAPWFAGVLFERSGNYKIALIAAAVVGAISVVISHFLPGDRDIIPGGEGKNY